GHSIGLWLIDIRDVTHPFLVSHYTRMARTGGPDVPNVIAKKDHYVFMTQVWYGYDPRLEIIDVQNTLAPQRAGIYSNVYEYNPYNIAVNDSLLFVAT